MSWEAQDLLAVAAIFDVELVQTGRGEEFYFKPKSDWTLEAWEKGTAAFCKITESSLEQYDSSMGQVYRPTKVTRELAPVIKFITKWPQEEVAQKIEQMQVKAETAARIVQLESEMYGDNRGEVLADFAKTTLLYQWAEQNSVYVMMQNIGNSEEEIVQILSQYSSEGIQKNTTEQGTIYYPVNPQDEKFLKFVADVSMVQQELAAQNTPQTIAPKLRFGAAAAGVPLAGSITKKVLNPQMGAQTGAHVVAGHMVKKSAFEGVVPVQIVRGGGVVVNPNADAGHAGGR